MSYNFLQPVAGFLRGCTRALPFLALTGALALGGCKKDDDDDTPATPDTTSPLTTTTPKPTGWGATIDDQMWAVIDKFIKLDPQPLPTLNAQKARMNPSVTKAVKDLLADNGRAMPKAAVTIRQMLLPRSITPQSSPDKMLVRVYTPTAGSAPFPVIVYYHGGGWVIGSLDVYEPSCMALCEKTGAVVVSVDYRLAPEHRFPAAHEDAFAAYKYVVEHTADFGGNPAKIAVAGESAGGNMAVTTSMLARDRGVALPKHQLVIYPVANNDTTTASYMTYAMAKPLDRPSVGWFTRQYFNDVVADGSSPLISLVDVANLAGLPPATIIAAEIDPLKTEGEQLRDKLGEPTRNDYRLFSGTTHEFFGTSAVVPKAAEAQNYAATRLKAAFQ